MPRLFVLTTCLLLLLATNALAQGRRGPDRSPPVGKPAPDFELHLLDAHDEEMEETIRLSSLRGEKPVVLIFGSYT